MSDVSRYRPSTPLVGAIRRALSEAELTEQQLLTLIQVDHPQATANELHHTLTDKSHLFAPHGNGWRLLPEAPRVIRQSPRSPPRSDSVRRPKRPASTTSEQHPRDEPVPTFTVVDPAESDLFETGLRLVVDVNPSNELEQFLDTADQADRVVSVVSSAAPENPVCVRPLVRSVNAGDRMRLVLGPSKPAQSVPGKVRAALGASTPTSAELTLVRDWQTLGKPVLTVDQAAAAAEPLPADSRHGAQVLQMATIKAQHLHDDFEGSFGEFAQWVSAGRWSPALKEEAFKAAFLRLPTRYRPEVAKLAIEVLGGHDPEDLDYCLTLLPIATRYLTGQPDVAYERLLLRRARELADRPEDQDDLELYSGRIAVIEGRDDDAIQLLMSGIASVEFGPDDADDLAILVQNDEHGRRAYSLLRDRFGNQEPFQPAINHLIFDFEINDRLRKDYLSEQVAQLIDAGEESQAVKVCQAWADKIQQPSTWLDILSEFETAEQRGTAEHYYDLMQLVAVEVQPLTNTQLIRQTLHQIQRVESGLGDTTYTGILTDRLKQLEPETEDQPSPFEGLRITVVGGRLGQVREVQKILLDNGAAAVDSIPARWEQNNSGPRFKAAAQRSDWFLVVKDELKHQDSEPAIAATTGTSCRFWRVTGGPSRVIRSFTECLTQQPHKKGEM